MRKKHIEELIKSMKKVEEGFAEISTILSAIDTDSAEGASDATAPKKATKKPDKKAEPAEDTTDSEDSSEEKDKLDAMKYNDLKKYGASLGVNVKGTREEITGRILKALAEGATADDDESEDDGKVVSMDKKRKSKAGAKKSLKKEEPAEDEEDDELDEKFLQSARELMEEYDLSELCDALEEVGVKMTAREKKKEDAIMRKVAEALAEGLLDTEDDEDEPAEVDDEDTSDVVIGPDAYFEEFDPEGINDPSSMSKKRKKAVEVLVAEILENVENEELTTDDMESELEDICTDDDIELLGDDYSEDDLLGFYIEMKKRFVDDDGETVEPGEPYEIDGENFCCGHKLTYNKKSKKYTCAVCEEEYEAD